MIDLMFQFGGEMILIKVDGSNIQFGNTGYGAQLSTIDGMRLDKVGVIKEHPDLKDNPDWAEEAAKRFKEHIKSLETEKARADYIAEDLKKFGYILRRTQEAGKRPNIIR